MRDTLERDGYCLLPAIDPGVLAQIDAATQSIESDDRRGGLREPQRKIEGLSALVECAGMHASASELLQADANPVRWILFDKTTGANWLVPWHRDTTIRVRERADVDGFGPWSVKDGAVHVQPPLEVLQRMVTLRLHIDAATEANGALRVLAGTHLCASLDEDGDDQNADVIEAEAGRVLAMKPLLLHASSKAAEPKRRRVLHIEYACEALPPPLEWA